MYSPIIHIFGAFPYLLEQQSIYFMLYLLILILQFFKDLILLSVVSVDSCLLGLHVFCDFFFFGEYLVFFGILLRIICGLV